MKDHLQIKYLGEDGENIPVAGAVAVCSPWDLLVSILILKFIFCISVGIDQSSMHKIPMKIVTIHLSSEFGLFICLWNQLIKIVRINSKLFHSSKNKLIKHASNKLFYVV